MNLVSPGDRDKLKGFLRQSTKSGTSLDPIKLDGLDREGKPFPIQMDCVLTHMDEEPCLQICIRNPAQVQGDEQGPEKFGERDELTGLYNRKFLTQYLNQVCAASSEEAGAVLYILLNDHRAISEQLGLEAADQLVVGLAKRLQGLVSEKEITARFSDAVFVIYTPESSGKALLQLGERLCAEIKSYVTNAARKLVSTSCSIGICMIQKSHENAMQVLSQVDRVCEIARQMGDNQVQIYPPLDAKPNQPQPEEKVSGLIRNAMDGERIALLYGPIASFQDNATERYKVYLRILGEDKKPLPMGTFGPVAESRGLMGSLDKWAIARGLKTISKRSKKVGKSTTLFIRISQNSVTDEDFHDWLGKLLKETGLGAEVLVIEVAEQCAEKCLMETKRLREQVQRLGGGFALSHLSGRPNSERVLNYLSPDYIKLDGVLIEKLSKNKDEEGRKVVANLTEQAQAKKIKVVAANVSTAPQMASIWQFGVTLVQGDMVQEPSPEMNFDFSQFTG
jgi:diguanylate cyclase (GGDEF)-like protein